jgi:fluoroacetyl-CoA thioesterase
MAEIPIGTRGESKILVTSDIATDFLGNEDARVLATPYLIRWLEMTCRNAVLHLLEPGHDTVGTHVDVRHLAATPIGLLATFRAELISVRDRRLNFRVEAYDEKEKIAEGTHERAVVDVSRFAERLKRKAGA